MAIRITPHKLNGDDYGRRRVDVFSGDQLVHFGLLNILSEHSRGEFFSSAARKLGCEVKDLQAFEVALLQAAEKADAEPDAKTAMPAPVLTTMSTVAPKAVDWLWPYRVARGKLTVFSGDPGLGKSFLTLDIASRVSRGFMWPDGSGDAPLGGIVLVSAEDDIADTIRPRLDAANADTTRIVALEAIRGTDGSTEYERGLDLSRDLPRLEEAIGATPDCALVVIDPVSAYLGDTKSHNDAEMRGMLAPLSKLAAKTNVAIIAVAHLRKSEGPAMYRTTGSLALVAAARAAFAICRDKDDESGQRRLFLPIKNNIGNDTTGLAFRIAQHNSGAPGIEWDAGQVTTKADEALAPAAKKPGPEPKEAALAKQFLHEALEEGPRLARELLDEAKNGHGLSQRTVERAKGEMGIIAYRDKVPGPWLWKLANSNTANNTANGSRHEYLGGLGGLADSTGHNPRSTPQDIQHRQDSLVRDDNGFPLDMYERFAQQGEGGF